MRPDMPMTRHHIPLMSSILSLNLVSYKCVTPLMGHDLPKSNQIQDLANLASPKNTVSVTHEHVAEHYCLYEQDKCTKGYIFSMHRCPWINAMPDNVFIRSQIGKWWRVQPHRSEPLITMMRRCRVEFSGLRSPCHELSMWCNPIQAF